MRRFVAVVVGLLLFTPAAVLAENFWWEKVKAVKLTSKTFDKYVGTGKYAFLEIFSKGCTFCEQFYPQFNQLYDDFMGKTPLRNDVFIGKVDAEEEAKLAKELGITLYPTFILLFPNDASFPNKYMFDRKYKVMKDYLLSLPKVATKESSIAREEVQKLQKQIKEFEKSESESAKLVETLKAQLEELKKSGATSQTGPAVAATPAATPEVKVVNGVTVEQLSKIIKTVKQQKRKIEKLTHKALEKLREANEETHSDDDALPVETQSKNSDSETDGEKKPKKEKPEAEKSPNAVSVKASALAVVLGFGVVFGISKLVPVDSALEN